MMLVVKTPLIILALVNYDDAGLWLDYRRCRHLH